MKKFFSFLGCFNTTVVMVVFVMSFCAKTANAQILQGSFRYAQDGHVYFYLHNPSGYSINVTWGSCGGSNKNFVTQGVMPPYSTFVYGPNAGWYWKKGEIFSLTYANGQSVYWGCDMTDPSLLQSSYPSFKGKGNCRHPNCPCTHYVSAGTGGKCTCDHWDYIHN